MPDDTTVERWLPVVDWEDLYHVNDLGQVWSTYRSRNKKLSLSKNGYLYVGLSRKGVTQCKWIHTLVIQAFIGPPPLGMECLHGPGGKLDNRLSNLSYGTHSQNNLDKQRDGTDNHRNLTHCPRGHLLRLPNLIKKKWEVEGYRGCLACNRTRAGAVYARGKGRPFNFKAKAMRHYARIMGFVD